MSKALAILALCAPAAFAGAQANLAPISAWQIDGTFYVGPGLYPAIQTAVSAACAKGSGQVRILFGATPADTIAAASGCPNVFINDQRGYESVFYSTTGTAYGLAPSLGPVATAVTSTFAAATLGADTCQTTTVPVPNMVVGTNAGAALPLGVPTTTAGQAGLLIEKAYVSTANTVTVTRCNVNGIGTLGVAAIAYRVVMF